MRSGENWTLFFLLHFKVWNLFSLTAGNMPSAKHLKRLAAPNHWMLDKLSGTWAPRPTPGPHKLRECIPLIVLLRNRLKYALTRREVIYIVKNLMIKVDGKVRTDSTYPAGFMDVIEIEKTDEKFRLLYDVKGRFLVHKISSDEATFKLCRIKKQQLGPRGIPYIVTHDGRTIRYPDPDIKVHDTVKVDLRTGRPVDFVKFDLGNLCMITGGNNMGRIGIISHRERHPGSFEMVHIKDAAGNTFATRLSNVFVIGKGTKAMISLPKNKGIKVDILEDRRVRLEKNFENKMRV
ncbi:hypothetical protein P9112_006714 [Eukaryota sp. TZLM1-RC]